MSTVALVEAWRDDDDERVVDRRLRQKSQVEMLQLAKRCSLGVSRISSTGRIIGSSVFVCQATRPSVDPLQVTSTQGRGATWEEAACGALLEAAERQAAATAAAPDLVRATSAGDLAADGALALPPSSFGLGRQHDELDCDWGMALRAPDARDVLVPACKLFFPFRESSGKRSPLRPSTSGLACGGTRLEAAIFALLELIERHDYSEFEADINSCRPVDLECMPDQTLTSMLENLRRSDIAVIPVFAPQTISPLVHTAVCLGQDQSGRTRDTINVGVCAHTSRTLALYGALTELFQSHATQSWGTREDLIRVEASYPEFAARAPDFRRFQRLREHLRALPAVAAGDECIRWGSTAEAAEAIFGSLAHDVLASACFRDLTLHGGLHVVRAVAPACRDLRVDPELFVSRIARCH